MNSFAELNLPQEITDALAKMEYVTPTPIQAQAIPLALEGHDILGSAQTGTGKTAAFGIPMLAHLINDPSALGIVLTPTRELATQVAQVFRSLLGKCKLNYALLIGGERMGPQLKDLKKNPQIIIGTPGRVNDHLLRGSLSLRNAKFLVLDETDRMLDMGFGIQIDAILKHMPNEKRQTMLFSATLPFKITKLANKYLTNPQRVEIDSGIKAADNIKQEFTKVSQETKFEKLMLELNEREGSIIVFVRTKRNAANIAFRLGKEGLRSSAIHGDLRQNQRNRVIHDFRNKKPRILIATDVVARGLDIPHVEHVINFDLPECPEDYIHRIGRTARAGAQGQALSLIAPQDTGKMRAIEFMLNPDKAKKERFDGKRSGSPRKRRPFSGRKRSPNSSSFKKDRSFFGEGGSRPPRKDRSSFGEGGSRPPRKDRSFFGSGDSRPQRKNKPFFSTGDARPQRQNKRPFSSHAKKKAA